MPYPTQDVKKTLRSIINTNIDIDDDQETPVSVSITVMSSYPEQNDITVPSIVIDSTKGEIPSKSLGQKYIISEDIYVISCFGVDTNDGTNIIDGESLIWKMNSEVYRIFLDPTIVINPTQDTNILFIKYEGRGDVVPLNVSPRLWTCSHILRVIYNYTT